MFSKKIIFPMAAFAMASFVACGDDSSSGASDVAPASVPTFMDLGDVPCSATQNLCAQVLVVEHNDFYQCNGTQWNMMFNGNTVQGCENAAPAAETPAEPAAETPAEPAAETPAEPAGPAAGGATCYMASDVPGMAECIPVTQDQCASIMGEWVDACPVN